MAQFTFDETTIREGLIIPLGDGARRMEMLACSAEERVGGPLMRGRDTLNDLRAVICELIRQPHIGSVTITIRGG